MANASMLPRFGFGQQATRVFSQIRGFVLEQVRHLEHSDHTDLVAGGPQVAGNARFVRMQNMSRY